MRLSEKSPNFNSVGLASEGPYGTPCQSLGVFITQTMTEQWLTNTPYTTCNPWFWIRMNQNPITAYRYISPMHRRIMPATAVNFRQSRWVPTVVHASENDIVININQQYLNKLSIACFNCTEIFCLIWGVAITVWIQCEISRLTPCLNKNSPDFIFWRNCTGIAWLPREMVAKHHINISRLYYFTKYNLLKCQ